MPHGTPDWGHVGPKSTIFGLDDLGEHAVRLGSPVVWDRRGNVILMDTFEHGLAQCSGLGTGANWDVALEGGYAWQGAFCAKLTTGDDAGDEAYIRYKHGLPVNSQLGLEFTFALDKLTRSMRWQITRNAAPGAYLALVWYDFQNDWLWCRPGVGPEVKFGLGVDLAAEAWHTGKLVADYSTVPPRYVRFILNDRKWDLTAHELDPVPGGPEQELWWDAIHVTNVDENKAAYVDNVIFTQNEP